MKCADPIVINKTEEDVPADNNQLTEEMTIDNGKASAVVSMGTELEAGAKELTLTTEEMDATTSNIQLGDGEQMLSMDVHVNGVSKDNTVPVIITIDEIAPEFLNQGNIKLYHVENGETVEMTRVYSLEEVDAHNEYYYDILTGTITMALASFSEVAVVADTGNAWEGNYDYSWYTNAAAPIAVGEPDYVIANADQLAAFCAIVGGMNGQTRDDFAGQTVKLLADIDLGDKDNAKESLIFHPIGYYYTNDENKDGTTGDYYSTVYSFRGTFDGNGHTISNFYQNTWEIKGDYDGNYYKDAMGLFGYVNGTTTNEDGTVTLHGATVKNLTVDNFSSDGEFTPTGVIAAYATNATFEN